MRPDRIKANGIHYTPPALADFLAAVTSDVVGDFPGTLAVLDPACGDGALLCAFVKRLFFHHQVLRSGVPQQVVRGSAPLHDPVCAAVPASGHFVLPVTEDSRVRPPPC